MAKKILIPVIFLSLLFHHTAVAQSGIRIIRDEAIVSYPDTIDFHLELDADFAAEDAKLLYRVESRSCQSGYAHQKVDFDINGTLIANWEWELKRSGTLPPGTVLHWQWEITDSTGTIHQTELQELVIQDERNTWKIFENDGVIVQWYVGSDDFGREIHKIAADSIARLTSEMGLIAEDDIHITVYPDSNEVRDVLFAATEWVGGVAFPAYNGTIIGVAPDEAEWAEQVIPHELTHLLVGTMMFNCYGISSPTWLEEGLAEYGENAIDTTYRDEVKSALEADTLPRLSSLERGFSAYGTDARLSYKQSGVIVEYLISTYGQEKITELLLTMKTGETINDALEKVYGFDTNKLDREWRASLGYESEVEEDNSQNPISEATVVPTLSLGVPSNSVTATPTQIESVPAATPSTATNPQADPPSTAPNIKKTRSLFITVLLLFATLLFLGTIALVIFIIRRKS